MASAKENDSQYYTDILTPDHCRWGGAEIGHLLWGSIMEVSSLLSITIGRFAARTSSGLGLLLSGAGDDGCARVAFCTWPAIHHCGGHCQDRPGLAAGRSTPRPGARDR